MRTFEYRGLRLYWLGHDGFVIQGSVTIVIDPYRVGALPARGDIGLVTHDHFDHLSPEDLERALKPGATVVAAENCRGRLGVGRERLFVKPGDTVSLMGVEVRAFPAYNVNKFRAPGVPFHPREYGGVGYLVSLDGVSVYHAGDTDFIEEMRELEGRVDIALLPVSGTYVMTAEEAAEAVRVIRPRVAIPMHYGAIVGGPGDAERFLRLASDVAQVVVLEPYG